MMKNSNMKSQKGAISLFVLLAMMFFLIFIMGAYSLVSKRVQTQTTTLSDLQAIYNKDATSLDATKYSSDNEVIPIYNLEQLRKIGTGDYVDINGKIYHFTNTSSYILKANMIIKQSEYNEIEGKLEKVDQSNYKILFVPRLTSDTNLVTGENYTLELEDGTSITIPTGYGLVDTKTSEETLVTIPERYANFLTPQSIREGIVIQDEKGNQFVWVPADVGDMSVKATGTLGDGVTTYTRYSKLYSFTDKTRDSYGEFYPYDRTSRTTGAPGSDSDYREPEFLLNADEAYLTADILSSEYGKMINSVEKYGGFYIGRYELTGSKENPTIQKGEVLCGNRNNVTLNWYDFYGVCKKITDEQDSTTSGMIYGCQWDATMKWLTDNGISVGYTKGKECDWGNYTNNEIKNNVGNIIKANGTNRSLETGISNDTKRNNIYDLAGNYSEWTQETYMGSTRVLRGGDWQNDSDTSAFPTRRSANNKNNGYDWATTRVTLYIK